MKRSKEKPFSKYLYYENSVQTPEEHVKIYGSMFREIRRKEPLSLREDFCGTFLISCSWVQSHPQRTAFALDLDPEPLEFGRKRGYRRLKPSEQRRLKIRQQDVCRSTGEKFDVIAGANFSFNVFKTRDQMKRYFKSVLKSLSRQGIFSLELAGGPGFIGKMREQKTLDSKEIGGKFTYYWDQQSFDPIQSHGLYAIHFRTPNGVLHKNCFVYDWRIWSITELRELMLECGFRDSVVYWEEADQNGNGTGEFVMSQSGDNAHSWIAFVVGIK